MRKSTVGDFIKRSREVHGNLYDYSQVSYKGANIKVTIKCPNGHVFDQRPNDHLRGSGCRICVQKRLGDSSRVSLEVVNEKLGSMYGTKYTYDFREYQNLESKILVSCEHGSRLYRVSALLKGYECHKCKGTKIPKINLEHFIEKALDAHGSFYDYTRVVINKRTDKITVGCPYHGYYEQTAGAHLSGQGCKLCRMSKGEIKIRKWLLANNIEFKFQHKFEEIAKYSFDFYLPLYNTCIEFDGEFHYSVYKRTGGVEGLEVIRARDLIKSEYCKKVGVRLIRIPYWNLPNIDSVLKERIEI